MVAVAVVVMLVSILASGRGGTGSRIAEAAAAVYVTKSRLPIAIQRYFIVHLQQRNKYQHKSLQEKGRARHDKVRGMAGRKTCPYNV